MRSSFRPSIESEAVEVCGLLPLNTQREPTAWHVLSRGTLDMTLVHPREAIKVACLANAAAVVLPHNHARGDPTPSREELATRDRLRSAFALVGIDLLDSLIIGDHRRYSSLRGHGQLQMARVG